MQSHRALCSAVGVALGVALGAGSGCGQGTSVPDSRVDNRNADNTGRNAKSQAPGQSTPFDQSEKSTDITITAEIRKALMADSGMSMNAQNCKVITANGTVTLEGVVDSQAEKDAVEARAKAVAGVNSVVNRLTIKTA